VTRFAVWLALASGLGHVEVGGDDDMAGGGLCLDPGRPALRVVAIGFVALAAAFMGLVGLGDVWPTPTLYLALVVLVGGVIFLVSVVFTVARSWGARQGLRQAKPSGSWHLHSFASARPGAGAALLDRVRGEAELAGRVVYLDTCEGLVGYYRRFGFEPAATVMMRRDGRPATVVRMVRSLQGSDATRHRKPEVGQPLLSPSRSPRRPAGRAP
jgi:hypothetical protein